MWLTERHEPVAAARGSRLCVVLVLSRKVGESIIIGNDVMVTIVEFRGDQVRLGVEAPRSVQVYREEIYAEVSRQNKAAASINVADLEDLPGPLPDDD